jgi:hypothetical protein
VCDGHESAKTSETASIGCDARTNAHRRLDAGNATFEIGYETRVSSTRVQTLLRSTTDTRHQTRRFDCCSVGAIPCRIHCLRASINGPSDRRRAQAKFLPVMQEAAGSSPVAPAISFRVLPEHRPFTEQTRVRIPPGTPINSITSERLVRTYLHVTDYRLLLY